jgi:alpha-tubulin suppressor-like RCC1 family protein
LTSNAPLQVVSSSSLDGFGSTFGTTCYLLGGVLTCWGNTEVAQIQQIQLTLLGPTSLPLASDPIESVAVGGDHVIATRGDSGACWGATSANQCNSGEAGTAECDGFNTYCEATAVLGLGISTGTLTVAGAAHTCTSPDANDEITCWGDNTFGQLGTESATPIGQVQLADGTPLDAATGLALGASHSCAIVGSGATSETYCWGDNADGQLGTGSIVQQMVLTATPIMLPSDVHFRAIAAGANTTCAIDLAKNVWCWGADTQGVAGQAPVDGAFPSFDAPTMTMVTDANAISVGYAHACAILASGAIVCWGDNAHGELGDGVANHMNASACGFDDCSWDPVEVKP